MISFAENEYFKYVSNISLDYFVCHIHENVSGEAKKKFAREFYNVFLNPDLIDWGLSMSSPLPSDDVYRLTRKASIIMWGNPSDRAMETVNQIDWLTNQYHDVMLHHDPSSIPDLYWGGQNHHENLVQHILKRYEATERYSLIGKNMLWYGELCRNQHPAVVDLVDELITQAKEKHIVYDISEYSMCCDSINIGRIAANPSAATKFLERGWLERSTPSEARQLLWKAFSKNPDPKAIRYIKENLDSVDFSWLSSNPNKRAVEILKDNPEQIDWNWLSTNPAAMDLLTANPQRISSHHLCQNPHADAIDMLYAVFESDPDNFNYHDLLLKNYWDAYRHQYVEY